MGSELPGGGGGVGRGTWHSKSCGGWMWREHSEEASVIYTGESGHAGLWRKGGSCDLVLSPDHTEVVDPLTTSSLGQTKDDLKGFFFTWL